MRISAFKTTLQGASTLHGSLQDAGIDGNVRNGGGGRAAPLINGRECFVEAGLVTDSAIGERRRGRPKCPLPHCGSRDCQTSS